MSLAQSAKLKLLISQSAAKSRLTNLTQIETALKSVNEKQRADIIKRNKLSDVFEADGSIKENVSAEINRTISNPDSGIRSEYYTLNARGKESVITEDLEKISAKLNGESVKNTTEKTDTSIDLSEEIKYNKEKVYNKKQQYYSQYNTTAMHWAFSSKTKPGDTKVLYNPKDNTWNMLVANDSEDRFGTLVSLEATPENAEAIKNLRNEVRNDNYSGKQRISETVYEDIDEYRNFRRNNRIYNSNVAERGADGLFGRLYSGESGSDRKTDSGKSTADIGDSIKLSRELSDATEAPTSSVRVFSGELTDTGRENLTKTKKALRALNKKGGADVSLIITEDIPGTNGVMVGDRMYITRAALESGKHIGTLVHEYTHFEEGTPDYNRLWKFYASDEEAFAQAIQNVIDSGYGITDSDVKNIFAKFDNGEQLTEQEQRIYAKLISEANAKMTEAILGNEQFIIANANPN